MKINILYASRAIVSSKNTALDWNGLDVFNLKIRSLICIVVVKEKRISIPAQFFLRKYILAKCNTICN